MNRLRVTAFLCLGAVSPLVLTAQDKSLPWKLTPIFAVGGADDSALVLSLLRMPDVAAGPENEVALVDRAESQIVILSPFGRVARRFGRGGAGPGELGFPTALAAGPEGAIWVWDAKRPGLVGFGAQGVPLPPPATPPGTGIVQSFGFLSDNGLVLLRSHRDSLSLWESNGSSVQVVAAVERLPAQPVAAQSCGIMGYPARPVFASDLIWAAKGDAIATNTESSFTIRIQGGKYGGTVLTRHAAPRIATEALAMLALGPGVPITVPGRDRPCVINSKDILAAAGFDFLVPAYRNILFTSQDTLWAVRYTLPGEARLADVFAMVGGYVGTVALGNASPVGARTDGSIVSIEPDTDDVPRLVVYRVKY